MNLSKMIIRLRSSASDCAFSCPDCHADLQPTHIKDQFICSICNETLQTDILAKASHLQTIEVIIKHAEAFKAALRDQSQLQQSLEVMSARTTEYQKKKQDNRNTQYSHQSNVHSKTSQTCSE